MATVGPATIAQGAMLTGSCPSRAMLLTGPWWGQCPMNSTVGSRACSSTELRAAVGPTMRHQEHRDTPRPPSGAPRRNWSIMGIGQVTAGSPGPLEPTTVTLRQGQRLRPRKRRPGVAPLTRESRTCRGSGSAPPTLSRPKERSTKADVQQADSGGSSSITLCQWASHHNCHRPITQKGMADKPAFPAHHSGIMPHASTRGHAGYTLYTMSGKRGAIGVQTYR